MIASTFKVGKWMLVSTLAIATAWAQGTLGAMSVSPAAGNGQTQSFTYTFADSAGAQDIGIVDILIQKFIWTAAAPASSRMTAKIRFCTWWPTMAPLCLEDRRQRRR